MDDLSTEVYQFCLHKSGGVGVIVSKYWEPGRRVFNILINTLKQNGYYYQLIPNPPTLILNNRRIYLLTEKTAEMRLKSLTIDTFWTIDYDKDNPLHPMVYEELNRRLRG